MCDETTLIHRLIDGELPAHLRRTAEEHLLICPSCAVDYGRWLRVRGLINQVPRGAAPARLASAIQQRVAAERRLFGVADIWFERRCPPEWASLALALSLIWLLLVQPATGLLQAKWRQESLGPVISARILTGNIEARARGALVRVDAGINNILGVR